jgi:hypothetical protein
VRNRTPRIIYNGAHAAAAGNPPKAETPPARWRKLIDVSVHQRRYAMSKWVIVALCAGGGAVVGVALGDLLSVARVWGIILAGLGGAIGAVAGDQLAAKVGQA